MDARAVIERLAAVRRGSGVFFLDYDGTLVPLRRTPRDAAPDADLLALLARLGRAAAVHVVSGRPAADLARWFGDLPVGLHAEHGAFTRFAGAEWRPAAGLDLGFIPAAKRMMQAEVATLPGSFVEEKQAGVVFHHRLAEPAAAARVRERLLAELPASGGEVLAGNQVVEVRCPGIHKGLVVPPALAQAEAGWCAAFGDDRTDEDLFAALPPHGLAVRVGGPPHPGLWLPDTDHVRRVLASCLPSGDDP